MLTDIEIAQKAKLRPILDIAKKAGFKASEVELYGKDKAKIDLSALKRLSKKKNGKLILVTTITPTSLGEGKTTATIGLGQAFAKLGMARLLMAENQEGQGLATLFVLRVGDRVIEPYGGPEMVHSCAMFDSVNEKYGLRGKRCAKRIGDAISAALPGAPYCLDRIDLDASRSFAAYNMEAAFNRGGEAGPSVFPT